MMSFSSTLTNDRVEQTITKIIIIGTYFGKWPVWFPAFLLSCAKNHTIEWLFFTDCEIPEVTHSNIKFERMNLGQLNDLASKKLGLRIQKDAFSQLNLRPAYGVIFEKYIKGFDFWGHCDFDVVWGDIRSFITEPILQNHDIVSGRKDFLAGHLTLWRNEPETNILFSAIPAYREIFSSSEHHAFDEPIMSTFLKTLIATGSSKVRVYWPEQMVTWFHEKANPNGWYWDSGKIFDAKHREHIYLHFQDWKKSVNSIDFQVDEQTARFKFTSLGIQSRRVSNRDLLKEKFKWKDLKGCISKFIAGSKKSLRLLKMILLIKDIYWAQRLLANSISARDVRYDRQTGYLFLKHLGLPIGKRQDFFLESYYWALQLVDQGRARFYTDEDELFIEVAGLRTFIQRAEEILILKELIVDGIYNMLFSGPAVVLDIGMNVGLTSLYFASQPNTVVVAYEPCEKQYNQALRNISLNPGLSDKIRPCKVGISDSNFKSIAMYPPKITSQPGLFDPHTNNGMGPKFEYEEIDIEDAADILDAITTDYPGRDVVVKIDFEHPEYHIDGVSEYHMINRLHTAGKLDLIEAIMLEWHKPKPAHDPPVLARQLSDYGFKVFLFTPHDAHEGMLYAVRRDSLETTPS
jgi:FkbM family methyltransferase